MKKSLFLLIPLLLGATFADASSLYPIGSELNPVHVEVEPTAQYRNQNLEASLKAQHGSSAFYSCMNKVSSCSGDQSDPSRRYSCLLGIQYGFESPLCKAKQPLQCDVGLTMVNGSCVRQHITPTACPSGHMFIGNGCAPFTCGAGYVPQGSQCVKVKQNSVPASQTQEQTTGGRNTIIEVPTVVETFGGAGGSGNGLAVEPCVRKVLSQDTNFGMLSPDECYATWQAAVEVAIANYQSPKGPTVAEKPDQVASVALAGRQAPVVEKSTQEPRRGFWSWLFSLFGL